MPSAHKRKGSTSKKTPTKTEPQSKKGSAIRTPSKSKASAPKEQASPRKSRNTVSPEFLASLITSKCSELKLPNLFTAKKSDKISEVWGKLIEKMIMAAPVVDDHGDFQGFIDTSDIASYLVAKFGDPILRPTTGLSADSMTYTITQELKTWMDKTVGDVMEFDYPTKLRSAPVCYANYSLLSAFEPLAMMSGLHRVAVVESPASNRLVSVITQSQALDHIFDNVGHLGSRKTKPVEECIDVVKTKGIFVVTKEHIALDAFQHMLKHGVSALAVVGDPSGHISGVIALRDLQVIGSDAGNLWKLYMGVDEFMKHKAVARVITVVERDLNNEDTKSEIKSDGEATGTGDAGTADMETTDTGDKDVPETKTAEPEPPKDLKAKSGSKKLPTALTYARNVKCHKGDTFMSVIKTLKQHGVHRLFVTDEADIPFGVVSMKEVLKEIIH